ncbi:MAG: Bacterial regulatory protein tetR family [Actinomycetota bacterium]|jgi:AcrR family transcriptional regulator
MANSYNVNGSAKKAGQVKDTVQSFIDAGIRCINEVGVDRITVSQVTEVAGATRPTFYSYFGNVGGLLAEIWIARGQKFLDRIVDADYRLDIAAAAEKAEMRALLEIFTVARRFPEVSEIVSPMTAAWWEFDHDKTNFTRLKCAWLVANRIGMWLSTDVEPRVANAAIIESFLRVLGENPGGIPADPRFAATPSLKSPTIADGSVDEKLLDATIRVISGSGVQSATMSRIARNAHVTTGTIYPRFNNEELLLQSYERAVHVVTEQNFGLVEPSGFAPDQLGAIVRGGLNPERKMWRNFRLEMFLDARHNPALAEKLRAVLGPTNARVTQGLGQLPVSPDERESIAFLVHTIGIGMAVLLNNDIRVDELDHALLTREIVAAVASR